MSKKTSIRSIITKILSKTKESSENWNDLYVVINGKRLHLSEVSYYSLSDEETNSLFNQILKFRI